MSQLIIRGGRVIDPANDIDRITDLYVANGIISGIGQAPDGFVAEQRIDATNKIVCPGIIDISARLREPGQEFKATIATETVAATSAGITTLCCPPDTDPVIDETAVVDLIHQLAEQAGHAKVVTLGAMTARLEGKYLSEMAALKTAGCVGIGNARRPVLNSRVLRRAFEYAATQNMRVFIESDDPALSNEGCAHEGCVATRLGLPGIPAAAETAAIARDLELIADTGVSVHFCRLSSARSVELIAQAQQRGLPVTADVSAHQLFLTEMDISTFNTYCHVLPPLRTQRDQDALRQGLADGIISIICSDHQPHEADAKLSPFPTTDAGISALETLLPLSLRLVEEGTLTLAEMITKLCLQPARTLGLNTGTLTIGSPADICIIDPELDWHFDEQEMLSQGKNSPFIGWHFRGRAIHTLVDGERVFCLG